MTNLGAIPELARRARRDARNPQVRALALNILRGLHGAGARREAAARLLHAVQRRVRFVRDESERTRGRDTFFSALQTWRQGFGDCDDSSPLLAALALSVGLRSTLVAMGPDGGDPTHVSVKLDGEWAEPTMPARLGEHPYAAAMRLGLLDRDDVQARGLGGLGAMTAERHRWARKILTDAWRKVRGRDPSPFEILAAQAWSRHDASYGLGWGPACAHSHNWGAIHARAGDPSCPWQDTMPDGTVYTQPMRVWPSDAAGAEAYIRHLSAPARPGVERALAEGTSVRAWLDQMRREKYFGGFCPKAAAKYGKAVNGQPGSSAGADACHAEAIDDPHRGALVVMERVMKEITGALGEPMPPMRDGDRRDPYYGGGGGSSLFGPLVVVGLGVGGYYYAKKKRWL